MRHSSCKRPLQRLFKTFQFGLPDVDPLFPVLAHMVPDVRQALMPVTTKIGYRTGPAPCAAAPPMDLQASFLWTCRNF